jgi:hypothetical protein
MKSTRLFPLVVVALARGSSANFYGDDNKVNYDAGFDPDRFLQRVAMKETNRDVSIPTVRESRMHIWKMPQSEHSRMANERSSFSSPSCLTRSLHRPLPLEIWRSTSPQSSTKTKGNSPRSPRPRWIAVRVRSISSSIYERIIMASRRRGYSRRNKATPW